MSRSVPSIPFNREYTQPSAMAELFKMAAVAVQVQRERNALRQLSDQALKDLGLSRADAECEGQRAVWDLPRNRIP